MQRSLILGLGAALALTTAALAADAPGRNRPDTDRDGRVTLAEQQAAAKARFARLDADKDGRVTKAELDARRDERMDARGERREARRESRRERMADPAVRAERLQQRFARLDTDRNGQLSQAEFAAGAEMRGHRGGKRHGRGGHDGRRGMGGGAMFDRLDRNNDGSVTSAEMDFATAERFSMLDADRDGVVTRDERRQHRDARRAQRGQAPTK